MKKGNSFCDQWFRTQVGEFISQKTGRCVF